MDIRRFKCPECNGEGSTWYKPGAPYAYSPHGWVPANWTMSTCMVCKGNKAVLVDGSGSFVGPDAPPRYFCGHGDVKASCEKCNPKPVHAICVQCFSNDCACVV